MKEQYQRQLFIPIGNAEETFPKEVIYFIDSNFHLITDRLSLNLYADNKQLSADSVETISISAYPTITNIFYFYKSGIFPIFTETTVTRNISSNTFLLYGENYNYTTQVLISTSSTTLSGISSVSTARMGVVSGYFLPLSSYSILNDNMLTVKLPFLEDLNGLFDIVIVNPAGYSSTYNINQFNFNQISCNTYYILTSPDCVQYLVSLDECIYPSRIAGT